MSLTEVLDPDLINKLETASTANPAAPPKPVTDQQVLNKLEYSPGVNPLTGTLESLLSGATFGNSDELQAMLAAAISGLPKSEITGETSSFWDRYKQVRDQIRTKQTEFREQSPVLAYTAEGIGGLTTGLGGLAKTSTLTGAGALGFLEGGIAGAGYADAEDYLSPETAIGAGIGAGVGTAAGVALPVLGRIAKSGAKSLIEGAKDLFPNARGINKKFIEQLASPDGLDDDMAKYIMRGSGDLAKDPLYPLAKKQGFSDGFLATIKGATPVDRQKALEMVKIIKRGKRNTTFKKLNRPGDVAGNTFLERINYVRDINKNAGREINRIAQGLRGEKVDINDALNKFSASLDDAGVALIKNRKGQIVPDFDSSSLSRGDRGPVKEVIRQVMRVINKQDRSAYDAHQLKRAIDNNVTWGKGDSLTSDASNLLKGLRIGIDDALDETFPDYNAANVTYKETIEALNDVVAQVGKKIDFDSDDVGKQIGQELRILMGNRQKRIPLHNAVKQMENTARKYGDSFNESAQVQAFIYDDLEDIFGASSSTAFRPEITKAIRDAGRGQKTITGAISEGAADLAESALEKAEGINEEAAFEIIEKILAR